MLLAAVSMGSDFNYEVTTNTTVGVMAALTVFSGLVNSMSTYWMEKMTKTYVIFHVAVLLSCCIALLAKTDNKHDAKYVFTDVEPTSGWHPAGFSFLFGFLSVSWTMTDYDATAHIAEEYAITPLLQTPTNNIKDPGARNQGPMGHLNGYVVYLCCWFPVQHCVVLLHGMLLCLISYCIAIDSLYYRVTLPRSSCRTHPLPKSFTTA